MTQVQAARPAGHALVEALVAQGVHTAFGVPGESYLAVLDGFHEHRDRIRFIACRQEGGAAFMAEAQGKLTGRPGVCFVTRGPGATNASIGLHTAFQDSTPMVLLVGQVASDQRDREAFQELDYRHVFGPGTLGMAKWVGEIHSADRLPEYVSRAFHTAMQGRPGPVVLVLPEDMLTTMTSAPVLPRAAPAHAWPAPGALREVRAMLLAAERPFVIVGGSGWDAESCLALQRFAENWQLPVGCGFRFQDTFDNRHAQYAGDVGLGINPKLGARLRHADLVLAIGVRLGEVTTGGYALLQAPRPTQKLIHVHAGAEELGRVYAADLLLQSSMAAAAKALEALAAPQSVPWAEHTHTANAEYLLNLQAQQVEPLDMAVVVKTLQRLAPADAVFTNGAGNFAGWLHRYVQYPGLQHHGRTQLAPTSGAMGYGVPAAVSAALLYPERTVINVAGDGDFLMTGQELATAAAYGAQRLISVVVDNGSFGTIRMHQERDYPNRVSGTALHNPDFAALARAYGWAAEFVERTDEFEPAFARALEAGRPTLLHLKLDPEVNNTARLYRIESMIRSRGHVSMADMLDELEVSRATLKRDLEYLRSRLGAPIEYDAELRAYRFGAGFRGEKHELPGLWFNERELYSLLMAYQLLSGLDTEGMLARHLQPLLDRIHEMLGTPEGEEGADALMKRVKIISAARRPVPGPFFERVAEAVLERRRLHLRYLTRARREVSEREISPQRLVHYRNTWYVDAWCHRVDGLRRFALDAIERAELLDVPATPIPMAQVEAAMDAGYGIYAGGEQRWATLLFDAQAAQWASREEWHPAQTGTWRDDGRYELRLPYVDETELLMDVLRQGEQVEVLAPPALRQAVRARLATALAVYGSDAA